MLYRQGNITSTPKSPSTINSPKKSGAPVPANAKSPTNDVPSSSKFSSPQLSSTAKKPSSSSINTSVSWNSNNKPALSSTPSSTSPSSVKMSVVKKTVASTPTSAPSSLKTSQPVSHGQISSVHTPSVPPKTEPKSPASNFSKAGIYSNSNPSSTGIAKQPSSPILAKSSTLSNPQLNKPIPTVSSSFSNPSTSPRKEYNPQIYSPAKLSPISSYPSFKFTAEKEKILEGTYQRYLQISSGGSSSTSKTSMEKLRACLSSHDVQVSTNAVAVAGMSLQENHGLVEIMSLLNDTNETLLGNLSEVLINIAALAKDQPNGKPSTEFSKLSPDIWTNVTNCLQKLYQNSNSSAQNLRMNIIKFLANVLSQISIISNFLKSRGLGNLCQAILPSNSNHSKLASSAEERHACLVLFNNVAACGKNEDWKRMSDDPRVVNGLVQMMQLCLRETKANPPSSGQKTPSFEALLITIQVLNNICQEQYVRHQFLKDKTFISALLEVILEPKIAFLEPRMTQRLSRICGNLMQDYEASKLLVNGGIFSFFSQCLERGISAPSIPSNALSGDDAVMSTLATIGNFALNDKLIASVPQKMSENQVLKSLQDILTSPSTRPEVRIRCGIAISNLMTVEALQQPFAQAGGIKTLLRTAEKHAANANRNANSSETDVDAEVYQKSLSALFHMSLYYDSMRTELVNEGSLKSLGNILARPVSTSLSPSQTETAEKAQMAAVKTLFNISMSEGNEPEFVKQEVVKPLIDILSSDSQKFQKDEFQNMTAAIIENLAQNDLFNEHLRSSGGIDAIINLAKRSDGKPKIQERAVKLIARLAVNGKTRQYLQRTDINDALKKMKTSGFRESISRNALDAALQNLSIPYVEETAVKEEEPLDKWAEYDLGLEEETVALSALREEHEDPFADILSTTTIQTNPISTVASPRLVEHPEVSLPSKTASSPILPTVNSNPKGPAPVPPPKPPPKPLSKRANPVRRAIASQPPRPAFIQQRRSPMAPAVTKAVETVPNAVDEEQFEDRGLRKESYLLVGDEATSPVAIKKKKGLFSSIKNLFASDGAADPASKIQLHEGPWVVNESIVSQKCPSLIYDYWDHWCENCKRNGSYCDQSTEDLRRLRIKLIKERAPKSFAPAMRPSSSQDEASGRTKVQRSNSDPAPKNLILTNVQPQETQEATSTQPNNMQTPPTAQQPPVPQPSTQQIPSQNTAPPPSIRPPRPPPASLVDKPIIKTPNDPAPQQPKPANQIAANVQPASNKKALPSDVDPEIIRKAKMHIKRTYVAQELLTTEGVYMQNLTIIIKKFQNPLTASLATPKPLVSEADLKVIFGSIEIIYNINLMLIEKLNMKMRRWTSKQTLGDVFIYMADWLKVYTDYINNYDKSQSTLLRCKEENPRLAQFLADRTLEPICALRGLETFLVTPIQRPPRYTLLLRELIKCTDPEHPDWDDLHKASERIEGITNYLNEKRREFDQRFKMLELAHSLTNMQVRAQIVQPHREYLLSAEVDWQIKIPSKNGYGKIYLLNDAFLLTKQAGKTRQKMVRFILLKDVVASIPNFIAGNVDDPHQREINLLHVATQEMILLKFAAIENRDQMYNHYMRLQAS